MTNAIKLTSNTEPLETLYVARTNAHSWGKAEYVSGAIQIAIAESMNGALSRPSEVSVTAITGNGLTLRQIEVDGMGTISCENQTAKAKSHTIPVPAALIKAMDDALGELDEMQCVVMDALD